jgi:single-strand DNA-binding protein
MVNRVILAGHCARDTVGIATQGKPMARMRIATSSVWRDANGERQESTEFHTVVVFGRLAEIAQQYCVTGRAVYLEGRLRTRDYVDGDGNRRFSTEVIADFRPERASPQGYQGLIRKGASRGRTCHCSRSPRAHGQWPATCRPQSCAKTAICGLFEVGRDCAAV